MLKNESKSFLRVSLQLFPEIKLPLVAIWFLPLRLQSSCLRRCTPSSASLTKMEKQGEGVGLTKFDSRLPPRGHRSFERLSFLAHSRLRSSSAPAPSRNEGRRRGVYQLISDFGEFNLDEFVFLPQVLECLSLLSLSLLQVFKRLCAFLDQSCVL